MSKIKIQLTKNSMIMMVLLFIGHFAWAHGEDKEGPHGGFIKMPGAFHTEVVVEEKNSLRVYLLDMEWKNPSTTNSVVNLSLDDKAGTKAQCDVKENYYQCRFPESIDLNKKGKLKLSAQREGKEGVMVSYSLPLKLEKVDKSMKHHGKKEDHKNH